MSSKIGNDLIEAYKGYYEDEWRPTQDPQNQEDYDTWVRARIATDTPKERLGVYLEWNGIFGYTNRIWKISQGEL